MHVGRKKFYRSHKPLIFAFNRSNSTSFPSQQRHLEFIAQFSTDISGTNNVVEDTLMRIPEIQLLNAILNQGHRLSGGDAELERLRTEDNSVHSSRNLYFLPIAQRYFNRTGETIDL